MSLWDVPQGYELKMRIVRALRDAMLAQSIENVTVAQICKNAQISRQTFYRHFEDKYCIANWYEDLVAEVSLHQIGRSLTWYEGHLKLYRTVSEERDFFWGVNKSRKDYHSPTKHSIRRLEQVYRETLTDYIHVEITPLLDYQLRFWCKSGVEAGTRCLLDGLRVSPQVFAAMHDSCVPRELYNIMNRHVLSQREQPSQSRDDAADGTL